MRVHAEPVKLWNLATDLNNISKQVQERLDYWNRRLEARVTQLEDKERKLKRRIEEIEDHVELRTDIQARQMISNYEAELLKACQLFRELDKFMGDSQEGCLKFKKAYARESGKATAKIRKYITYLEKIEEGFSYQQYSADKTQGAFAGQYVRNGQIGYYAFTFRGVRFYVNDANIDYDAVDEKGKTSLQRMKEGIAPLGKDGKSINLHHVLQRERGPILELPQTIHQKNHVKLHINTHDIPSGINRDTFKALKAAYWQRRADFILMDRHGDR